MSGVATWVALIASSLFWISGVVSLVQAHAESARNRGLLVDAEIAKNYTIALKQVDIGKGVILCKGVEFTVVNVSTDGRGWTLQAEDTKTLTKRTTVGGSDV